MSDDTPPTPEQPSSGTPPPEPPIAEPATPPAAQPAPPPPPAETVAPTSEAPAMPTTAGQPAPTAPQPATLKLPFPLQDNETVVFFTRRHWWFLWPMTVLLAILAFVPIIVASWLLDVIGIRDDLSTFLWIAIFLWLLYWGVRAALNWYRYHHDIWVITNQRIIDSFKPHPFSFKLATADLVNLQDIKVQKTGITASILNYGNVVCSTAGTAYSEFTLGGVAQPEALQLLIDRERDRERNRVAGANPL